MRTYYIFKINKYFSYVYRNKPYKIYKTIEEIYHTKDYDMVLTYKIYEQVALTFNKNELNEYLKNIYNDNCFYNKNSNIHTYNDIYEHTKLVITNSNLKIKTNINNPIFLKDLSNYYENIFICDFVNKDYFWLGELLKKDRQNNEYLVK